MKERLDSNFLLLKLLFNMMKLYSKDLPLQHPFMGSKHVARESPEFMNLSRKSYKSMPKVLCEEIFGLKLGFKRNRNVSLRASVLFFSSTDELPVSPFIFSESSYHVFYLSSSVPSSPHKSSCLHIFKHNII